MLLIKLQHVLINKDHGQGHVLRADKWYCQGLHNIIQKDIKYVYAFHTKYRNYIHTHSSPKTVFSLFFLPVYFYFTLPFFLGGGIIQVLQNDYQSNN